MDIRFVTNFFNESTIVKFDKTKTSIKEIEKAIYESTFVKSLKKGSILLKEGSISNECYFILNGCIRSYCLKGGEEKTVEYLATRTNFGNARKRDYSKCRVIFFYTQ